MARVTVEDCLENVDNRFHLVLLASKRARQLERGAQSTLAWANDKPTVVALREIAEGTMNQAMVDKVGDQQQQFGTVAAPLPMPSPLLHEEP